MLWLFMGKTGYKALHRAFMLIYPKNYFIMRVAKAACKLNVIIST